MHEIWARIERWLRANAPEIHASLRPGVPDAEIEALEERIGVRLPDDVRESLRIHDGQEHGTAGLYEGSELLSTRHIADEWQVWKELLDDGTFDDWERNPDPGVRADWWNPRWIPLTHDAGGNHDCLDLDPAPGGREGQIISLWHDEATRSVLAGSYREWLSRFADRLEAGSYAVDEHGWLVGAEDAAEERPPEVEERPVDGVNRGGCLKALFLLPLSLPWKTFS